MKKSMLFIIISFCFLSNAYSQEFRLGVKGGLNASSLGVAVALDTRISFHAGV